MQIKPQINKRAISTLILSLTMILPLQAKTISFEPVNVISMNQQGVQADQRVIVEDNKIVAIEPVSQPTTFKVDKVIDSKGKYMLPGFAETHYHLTSSMVEEFKLLLINGVTSVRNMSDYPQYQQFGIDIIEVRKQANTMLLAPWFFTAGPPLEKHNLKTPADAIAMVKYHTKRDYDFIKVHDDFSADTYLTLLRHAEQANIPVVGHAQRDLALDYSLRLKSIAHVEEFMYLYTKAQLNDDVFLRQLAKQVKDSGVYLSPTLSTFALIARYADDQRFEQLKNRPETALLAQSNLQQWAVDNNSYRQKSWFTAPESLKRLASELKLLQRITLFMHQVGVPLMVGSDTYGLQVPGFSLHDEMLLMHQSGLSAYDVLKAATATSARHLGRYAIAGTISVGKNAEFVLFTGDVEKWSNPLA
ncbi:MAG: imidazolonepropionase-like amidohydrolase [Phenylobacterium sp.]|jgi:imidazolonepropionase-like amidohydrolase